jgi:hypothetical protein
MDVSSASQLHGWGGRNKEAIPDEKKPMIHDSNIYMNQNITLYLINIHSYVPIKK